eukprot:augustus_masked-scaffold_51-processed-gene-1.90-mRNA-1 protein AED:1.00 eAED:1.00 QI:0/-1/0/0/-1/1/1/0/669
MKLNILLAVGIYAVYGQSCDRATVGVNLLDCPLDVWKSSENPTSEEDPLQLEYRTVVQRIPAMNQTSQSVIEGEYLDLTVKTYAIDGLTVGNPSPIWQWEKGATVHVNLTNNLHINYQENTDEFQIEESEWLEPHWGINIHTHGLHISSDSMQDDPSREIHVSESGMYKFELPGNHLGGFHWYHPHIEAVSELTVGSGTFGPLVVETSEDGSEISALVGALEQHIFTISKIYPAKLVDLSDGFIAQLDAINGVFPRENITDSTFKVEYNEDLEEDIQLEEENTNYTLINGFLRPKITMVANEWYRFAFLYAGGTDEEADLTDVKFKIGKNTALSADEGDFGILEEQEDTICETKLIAKDGVYLRESRNLDFDAGNKIWTAPANRFEILFKCSFEEEGVDNSYALIMDTPEAPNRAEDENIKHSVPVLQFEVLNTFENQFPLSPLAVYSFIGEQDFQMKSCYPSYLPDMRGDDVEIASHIDETYTDEIKVTIREETLNFDFLTPVNEGVNTMNLTVTPFNVNGDYFRGYYSDDKTLNITVLRVQKIYQFNLNHGHHPLHIHVNHYQLQNAADDGSGYHQAGDFVDTLTSACDATGCVNGATGRPATENTFFRMYTDRYPGRMIGHCHNMDHSDSLALGEMWILPDEESTLFDVEPQWLDTCSEILDIVTN